jgi:hypothetical protein
MWREIVHHAQMEVTVGLPVCWRGQAHTRDELALVGVQHRAVDGGAGLVLTLAPPGPHVPHLRKEVHASERKMQSAGSQLSFAVMHGCPIEVHLHGIGIAMTAQKERAGFRV